MIGTPAQHAPDMGPGDYLQCAECGSTVGSTDAPSTDQCPDCESWGKFVRRRAAPERSVSLRWPGVSRWTPLPNVLARHPALLGLQPKDIGLLAAIQTYRMANGEAVFTSFVTLASNTGISEDTIQRTISRASLR